MTFGRNRQNIRGIVKDFDVSVGVSNNCIRGGEMMCLSKRDGQFSPIDFDVGDVEFVLRHLGTKDDKPPMSVRRDKAFRITFCEESVFASLEMVSKPSFEHASEGQTLF